MCCVFCVCLLGVVCVVFSLCGWLLFVVVWLCVGFVDGVVGM